MADFSADMIGHGLSFTLRQPQLEQVRDTQPVLIVTTNEFPAIALPASMAMYSGSLCEPEITSATSAPRFAPSSAGKSPGTPLCSSTAATRPVSACGGKRGPAVQRRCDWHHKGSNKGLVAKKV